MSSHLCERPLKAPPIWKESPTWNIPWIYVNRGEIWKGDILVQPFEELENLDASEIHARRLNAKEVSMPEKGDNFVLPIADGTAKLLGRDHEFRESDLRQEQPVRSEDLSGELQGEPEGFQPTESRGDDEARRDFWSIQSDFISRHHNELRVQLYVSKEETFPIPLKYIDVTKSTHTNLDVLPEKRIPFRPKPIGTISVLLELFSRFEFDFRRCENHF